MWAFFQYFGERVCRRKTIFEILIRTSRHFHEKRCRHKGTLATGIHRLHSNNDDLRDTTTTIVLLARLVTRPQHTI